MRENVTVDYLTSSNLMLKPDGSYALASIEEQTQRSALLSEPHAVPLRDFVLALREQTNLTCEIPHFDPQDGGVNAKVLFLLEAPGPKAVTSGFISRDNPDPTARRFKSLLESAGLSRDETAIWNIVPYYIGNENRSQIRAATSMDVSNGFELLTSLLPLFTDLKAIVLLGRKAQKSKKPLEKLIATPIFETFHCSNLAINGRPEVLPTIQRDLAAIKKFISS